MPISTINAKTRAGIALRIKVDDQYLLANGREGCREIDGGRGLAHAALLVRH